MKDSRLELISAKQILRRKKNRFKRLLDKYDFLKDIISETIDDIKLKDQIIKLFEDLGYNAVKPKTTRDFDGIIKFKKFTIGIEVKNSRFPEENELFQALKYSARYRSKGKVVKPIVIWNNAKTGQNFDQYRIEDAINNNYGLLNTNELLKGFIKVKQGKITLDSFEKIISRTGLVKFSNKAIIESG